MSEARHDRGLPQSPITAQPTLIPPLLFAVSFPLLSPPFHEPCCSLTSHICHRRRNTTLTEPYHNLRNTTPQPPQHRNAASLPRPRNIASQGEANSQKYLILDPSSLNSDALPTTRAIPSSRLRVGDLVVLEKNQRVPADLVLLRTSDSSGTCFIRTDQLDGETDWKLRVAVPSCQKLGSDRELLGLDAEIYGGFLSR